jgi:hypothetical protein
VIVSKPSAADFFPHDWVQLMDVFSRIVSITKSRDLALHCLNRDLRSGLLGSALVQISPDGKETVTLLNPSDWEQRTVQAPKVNPEEGVRVEPYVEGSVYVRRVDLDKYYPLAGAPVVPQSDDTRPPPRRRGPVTTHDWHSIDGEIARRCIDPETSRVAVPKKENALVSDMRAWCEEQGWAVPATSEMSEAVRRVCAALRNVQK